MTSVGRRPCAAVGRGRRCPGARRACAPRRAAAPPPRRPAELASTSRALPSARRTARAPGGVARRGEVDVAAVHRDDERRARARARSTASAAGHRVVGVHEVVGELAAQPAQRAGERRRRPRAPGPVAARARRGEERHVAHVEAVERDAPRLGGQGAQDAPGASRRRVARGGTGRCSTSTRTSAPASRAASAWRWAQTPSTGSCGARIELADDRHLHAVATAERARPRRGARTGRPARKARASASAASRGIAAAAAALRVADRRGVDDPDRPAVLAPRRRPSGRRVPSPSAGPRGRAAARRSCRGERRSRGRSPRRSSRARSRPACRRVTGQAACECRRCAGWASFRPVRSAAHRKASRKPRGSATSSSMTSSQS